MHFQCPAFVFSSSPDFWFWYHNCAWMISYIYCIYFFTGESCHLWYFCFCSWPFITAWKISFSICCKAGLVVLNFLSFCLSVKLWFFLQIWMRVLLGKVILVGGFFPFHPFKYIMPLLLAFRVSAEKSANNFSSFPCMLFVSFL